MAQKWAASLASTLSSNEDCCHLDFLELERLRAESSSRVLHSPHSQSDLIKAQQEPMEDCECPGDFMAFWPRNGFLFNDGDMIKWKYFSSLHDKYSQRHFRPSLCLFGHWHEELLSLSTPLFFSSIPLPPASLNTSGHERVLTRVVTMFRVIVSLTVTSTFFFTFQLCSFLTG